MELGSHDTGLACLALGPFFSCSLCGPSIIHSIHLAAPKTLIFVDNNEAGGFGTVGLFMGLGFRVWGLGVTFVAWGDLRVWGAVESRTNHVDELKRKRDGGGGCSTQGPGVRA